MKYDPSVDYGSLLTEKWDIPDIRCDVCFELDNMHSSQNGLCFQILSWLSEKDPKARSCLVFQIVKEKMYKIDCQTASVRN